MTADELEVASLVLVSMHPLVGAIREWVTSKVHLPLVEQLALAELRWRPTHVDDLVLTVEALDQGLRELLA